MFKYLCFCLLSTFILIKQANAQEFDLRKVRWGMSRAEVHAAEGRKPLEERREGMVYSVDFLGSPTFLTYFFAQDKVVAAAYIFKMNKQGSNLSDNDAKEYMGGFGKLESLMSKKYGQPQAGENMIWANTQHKDKPGEMNSAFMKGHVKFISEWATKYTDIKLGLKGGNDQAILAAIYTSKGLEELIANDHKIKKAIAMDDL